jgi:subtilisin family serine protease
LKIEIVKTAMDFGGVAVKNSLKLFLFSVLGSVALSSMAQADQKVIVVMKDAKSFQLAHQAYINQNAIMWKNMQLEESSLNHIEDSLENLNTFIVNAKNESEIENLKNNPAVQLVEKDVLHPLPKFIENQFKNSLKNLNGANRNFSIFDSNLPGAKTPWGVMAVRAPQAWSKSNQGLGARVLILDTGIDKEHMSLKANFEKGRDFTGRSKGEDYSDLIGHGSHVAGTIAGVLDSSGFTGVAPQAKLLMGRVCSPLGCSTSAIIKGVNWGISEKVDVISMSLGGGFMTASEQDAVKKADTMGVSIVAASGNDGTEKVSYPAALATAVAVGAVDSNLKKAEFSQYGPELSIVAPGVDVISTVPRGTGRGAEVMIDDVKVNSSSFSGAREVMNAETNVLVSVGFGKPEDYVGKDVKGKFVLASRGEIYFADKIKNALAAGAVGLIVYNNAPGLISGALSPDGKVSPVAIFMIEQEVGKGLVEKLNAGQVVNATVHTLITDYMAFQGTSMATPHVSGVVALMKAANHNLTPDQVKIILQKTATVLGPNDKNQYGAGMVNAEAAVDASLLQN